MSKICFFEGENIGIGILLNSDYSLNRIIELELLLKSKNTEVIFDFKKSNNSLIADSNNNHLFKAFLTNSDTLGKSGEYEMQVRLIDGNLGEKKTEIAAVHIHRSIIEGVYGGSSNTEVLTHVFEITITDNIISIGNYNVNVTGSTSRIITIVSAATTGHEITHNLNCDAVKATFFDADGEPEFNFLYKKKRNQSGDLDSDSNNKLVCIFPTEDAYSGKILIEKLY